MLLSKKPRSLNKLTLGGPVWLASDIHLGAGNPATADHFFEFLDQASAQAGALVLLGDVFDVWIGDDWIDSPPPWLVRALEHLRATARRCPLWLGHGNRDFLMGTALAQSIGARLLPGQTLLQVQDTTVLLAHGDEFCTDDLGYQRFRRVVRQPAVQRLFLALPLSWRQRIAEKARAQSQQTQMAVGHRAVDANPNAMASALQSSGAHTLIHGHTHRPSHDEIRWRDIEFDRWVLADWEADHLLPGQSARGGWIVISRHGVASFDANGQPQAT